MQASRLELDGDLEGAIALYERLYAMLPNEEVVANNLASLLSTAREDEASLARASVIARRLRDRDPELANGRVIVAHLGNGASMCATQDGRSIASTMGFTALDGLPMGTRCGQIDPGVLLYLMAEKGLDAAAISQLLYHLQVLMIALGLDLEDVYEYL